MNRRGSTVSNITNQSNTNGKKKSVTFVGDDLEENKVFKRYIVDIVS